MPGEPEIGPGLQADDDVVLGYRAERGVPSPLVVGRDARLRSGTVLYAGTRIGDRFQTGHHVVIREESRLGDDVAVWSNSVVDYGCVIGDRVKIHSNCYVAQNTDIGADAFLAPGVTLANDLYPGQAKSADVMTGPTIGEGAQIGVNATVLPFVTVGAHVIVGAGAVVTRDVPSGMVAYGNPAVSVRGANELRDIAERIEPVDGAEGRFRLRQRGPR